MKDQHYFLLTSGTLHEHGTLRHNSCFSTIPFQCRLLLECDIAHYTFDCHRNCIMASVLFVGVSGQDPNIDLPPGVSAQELDTAIHKGTEAMKNAGYKVTLLMPPIMDGIAALEKDLETTRYDLVLVSVCVSNLRTRRRSLLSRTSPLTQKNSSALGPCRSIHRILRE